MAIEQIEQEEQNDELGLSEKEFRLSQGKFKQEVETELRLSKGREREKEARLYFEFKNSKQRNAAMNLINRMRDERREFDDDFLYFEGCSVDPVRKDIGIEIRFSKHPGHIREKFEELLTKHGLTPKEEYETADGEPEPEETRINPQ